MKKLFIALLAGVCLTGCVSTQDSVLGTSQTQVQMRNYQSRAFDTNNKDMVLRAVISTMQDLGFIVERADEKLGTISATSFNNGSKLTVSVRNINSKQIVVRVNAQVDQHAVEDPVPYQNFFNALGQSLFLEAHEVR